ncbi:hypothetical protein [Tenacibaculum sp. 190524A05c]|uniref:hypothetical protein n=1 Tax=Tenacibaculum platacis TaxID=3137852 RepID=UPI0032B120C2
MKEDFEYKLEQIKNVWNQFIWEYDFCKKEIKFDFEARTNYFGDIFGYFLDTNVIILQYSNSESNSIRFSNQISLLQSIYVQQDFIEELLRLFKLRINKGDLKKDPNYTINRNIRNELVGHPIRRENGNGELISSCLFGYNGGDSKITYLKYHRENNFKFESMEFLISEIISRHKEFLNYYFDKILNKLKRILSKFIKKIDTLESLIENKSFNEILNISEVFFESIFESDYIYDKDSLLIIYSKKNDHLRYQNFIDRFYRDLKTGLKEIKEYVKELFEPQSPRSKTEAEKTIFKIEFVEASELSPEKIELPITYHYELGKLAI